MFLWFVKEMFIVKYPLIWILQWSSYYLCVISLCVLVQVVDALSQLIYFHAFHLTMLYTFKVKFELVPLYIFSLYNIVILWFNILDELKILT